MKTLLSLLLYLLLALNLHAQDQPSTEFQQIAEKIMRRKAEDQNIMMAHQPGEAEEVRDSLYREKDRILSDNCKRIQALVADYGYLGYDKLGRQASDDFWLIVQHCDEHPEFQRKILKMMKPEVEKGNASGQKYAYLTDRVRVNAGEPQLYGTQVITKEDMWIVPKPLLDSASVDIRRKEVGLEPLKDYLNMAMKFHYQMNQEQYEKAGMDGPRQYSIKK